MRPVLSHADIGGMVLSDVDIAEAIAQGKLVIDPLDPSDVQPCSVDLHLHPSYRRFDTTSVVDLGDVQEGHTTLYVNDAEEGIEVGPGECVLMSTLERVALDATLAAQVDGKSSLGRLFQSVHITAGWIDAGFDGQITLEVVNHTGVPFIYRPYMSIAQLVVQPLSSPAEAPYGVKGHYQSQVGPVESKYRFKPRNI